MKYNFNKDNVLGEILEQEKRIFLTEKDLQKKNKKIAELEKIRRDLQKSLTDGERFYNKLLSEKNNLKDELEKTKKELEKLKNPPKQNSNITNRTTKTPANYTEKIGNVSFDMVFLKGGTFKMGSNEFDREKPIHNVTVSDFYIGKYPVTQKLWKAVMGNNPSNFKGCDDCPVEQVSWNDAQKFIEKLNKKTGKKYRLPSEAEWEYAARGGVKMLHATSQHKYAGSNNIDEVAWYDDNSGQKTHLVRQKMPNELGIYDISGNVWEWCQDKWHDNYKGAPIDGSAWESGSSSSRVYRGGSWDSYADGCRVAYRYYNSPTDSLNILGFRLARQP